MFLDKFDEFIDYLNNNSIVNEWYMSDFAEKNIKTLDAYEAFNNLKLFVSYMIERYHPDFEYEIVETLKYLKYQINSNELFYSEKQKNKIFELYTQEYSKFILSEIFK